MEKYFVLLLIILFWGCELPEHYNQDNIESIDFSDTVDSNFSKTADDEDQPIYVAISAMISPKETFSQYQKLLDYISDKIDKKIELKQRKTYLEINELLKRGELDFAFICTGAYNEARKDFPLNLLSVPVVNGEPFYRAYVIVNEKSEINSIDDLANKSFAFTDPLSNTGHRYIVDYLAERDMRAEKFFSNIIYTYAHDYSIQAVSKGIVDGASIDGLIYDYFNKFYPERIANIKIIHKSMRFGIPPFVHTSHLSPDLKKQIQNIMLSMHLDDQGKKILDKMMVDKFIEGDLKNYSKLTIR